MNVVDEVNAQGQCTPVRRSGATAAEPPAFLYFFDVTSGHALEGLRSHSVRGLAEVRASSSEERRGCRFTLSQTSASPRGG